MNNCLEAKFIRESDVSGRELHCQVDDRNRVSWRVVPAGEQGISIPFRTPEQAKSFMEGTARILGYPNRLASE